MHQIDPIKRERATAVLVHFCHTKSRFQEKKIFWALPWENLRLLMWPKNSNSSYFGQNSEMQNCQDYTDPTVYCHISDVYCQYLFSDSIQNIIMSVNSLYFSES